MKPGALKKGRKPRKARTKRASEAPTWAVANPIRLAALTLLHERALSPNEIASEVGLDPVRVTEQMRLLYDAGCIEFVGRSDPRRRNFSKTVYRAVARSYVNDEEYRSMPLEERDDLNGVALQWIISECIASHRSGKMSRDENLCLLSDEPNLDAQGRKELSQRLLSTWAASDDWDDVSDTVQEIAAKAANRMAISGEKGSTVVVALLAFDRERSRVERSEPQGKSFGKI